MDLQIQEVQWTVSRINTETYTETHYNHTCQRQKSEKAAREKLLIKHKILPNKVIADFSAENLQARRQLDDIFKVLKEKMSTDNSISGKTVLQKWGRNLKHSYTKVEFITTMRNVKGSPSWKDAR